MAEQGAGGIGHGMVSYCAIVDSKRQLIEATCEQDLLRLQREDSNSVGRWTDPGAGKKTDRARDRRKKLTHSGTDKGTDTRNKRDRIMGKRERERGRGR